MNHKEETVLISGGLGQIGFHVYLQLKDKYNVCILDNASNAKVTLPKDVVFREGDIQNNQSLVGLPKIDLLVHCAAQISPEKSVKIPIFDAKVNIIGTLNLLEFARKKAVKKFIHISSAATYGNPQFVPITEDHPKEPVSPYGLSKLAGEKYVQLYSKLYNLDATTILPFNVYSLLQKENDPYAGVIYKFIKRIKKGKAPIIEGDGLQTRDFIHVEDVAIAIDLALSSSKTKGMVINIGTGKAITINKLAQILISISEKKLTPQYVASRLGDIRESCASIKTAKQLLGFKPSISIEEGLKEIYNKIQI